MQCYAIIYYTIPHYTIPIPGPPPDDCSHLPRVRAAPRRLHGVLPGSEQGPGGKVVNDVYLYLSLYTLCIYIYIYMYIYVYICIMSKLTTEMGLLVRRLPLAAWALHMYIYIYMCLYLSPSLSLSLYIYIYIYNTCAIPKSPSCRAEH